MTTVPKKKRTAFFILSFIILAGVCATVFAVSLKKGMHVDEYYSYGLSNYSGDNIFMSVDLGKTYTDPKQPFLDYMTVEPGNGFSYDNVWDKQSADVHPPFYYVILHTICSFFPAKFSIWFAAVINITFFSVLILLTYLTMKNLTTRRTTALTAALFCALAGGLIQINTFLRMYTMLMFITALLTWLHVKHYKNQPLQFFICYPLVILSGMLTHYYFFIFLFLQGLYFGFSLLLRRRWKSALLYLAETLAASAAAVFVFPAVIEHIFTGYRGKESLDNLAASTGYIDGLKDFFQIISRNLTGNLLYVILILFAAALIWRLRTNKKIAVKHIELWGMLLIPTVCYFLLVSKIAVYHYDRYISPAYPVLILLISGTIDFTARAFFTSRNLRLTVVLLLTSGCILLSYWGCDWIYLEKQTELAVETAQKYAGLDCIVINDGVNFWNHTLYYEVINYETLTFLSSADLKVYADTDAYHKRPVIVYIMNILEDQDALLRDLLAQNPSYSGFTHLTDSHFARAYLLQ